MLRTLLTLIAATLTTLALTTSALAQTQQVEQDAETEHLWNVQLDPLTTALGFVHVQVERTLSPNFTIYAGPHLRLFDGVLTPEPEPFRGFGAEVGVRWFPWGDAPSGAWLLARGVGAVLTTTDGSDVTGPGGYVSALGGYTWILGPGFVLSGGAGAQYLAYDIQGYGPRGFNIALHTALGWAW